jgi:hypothetical protein
MVMTLLLAGCATGPWSRDDCGAPCAVPSAAQPTVAEPACLSGLRVEPGRRDAAMGLRVESIVLVNCGTEPYSVQGFPRLELADADGPRPDVRILDGVLQITGSPETHSDEPQPVTLQPGERASALLAWRNTYDDVSEPPVTVTLVRVVPEAGLPAQELIPDGGLDLGSTGRLGVGPWFEDSPA